MLETGNNPFYNKRLSIRVSTGGFSFISDNTHEDVKASGQTLSEALQETLRKWAAISDRIRNVELLCDTLSTRIPLNEFRSEEVHSLFRLTYGKDAVPQGWSLRYEILPKLELVEVFIVNTTIEQMILDVYPQATIHSYHGQILLHGLEIERNMPLGKRRIHACACSENLLLFTYVDNQLHYCNSFPASEMSTKLYYTLYVWNHMELAQERDILIVHGKAESYVKAMKEFIREIVCE